MGRRRRRREKSAEDDNVNETVDMLLDCFKRGLTSPKSMQKEKVCNDDYCSMSSSSHGMPSMDIQSAARSSLKQVQEDTCKTPHEAAKHLDLEASPKSTRKQQSCSKQISPGVFYGSPHGMPSKKPCQLLRLLHEIRNDLTDQKHLHPRKAVWATFPRQDQAIQFADSHTQVAVFSYQDHVNKQRRFLATTYEEFWQRYKTMDSKYRHHYEIIREGYPCQLYFDLEYNRSANIEANGVEMVDLLLSVVSDAMLDIYRLSFEPDWTVELDSSTEEKFSRHLIIHVPNAAFKDNSHVGAFVGEICARIARLREIDTKFNKLYVFKDQSCVESRTELFLDSAVYSRNRCFRLPLSSKAGKSAVLLPTERFKCKDMSDDQMFMDSLICRMDANCKWLLPFDSESDDQMFMDSLICRMDANCKWLLPFDSEAINNGGAITNLPHVTIAMKHRRNVMQLCISGQSPFPTLDAFVESIASIENVSGRIRSWYWFSEYGVMVYNISGNRFCERIGRQHKSNHVMYIVDFRTAGYYQKCHDPDCKGYRSPLRPIPWNTIPGSFPASGAAQIANNGAANNVDIHHNLSLMITAGDNCTSSSLIEGIFNENSEKDNWEDEAWWEEVISTVDDVESRRKPLGYKKQDCTGTSDQLLLDDDWWMAAACKASELEKMTAWRHDTQSAALSS